MKPKLNRRLVFHPEEDVVSYRTPSMKKAEEDRNKVIPNYVMDAVRSAFQKKLSTFFSEGQVKSPDQVKAEVPVQDVPQPEQPEQLVPAFEAASTIEKLIGAAAVNIAREVKANCIVTIEKTNSTASEFNFDDVKVAIFKHVKKSEFQRFGYNTRMRKLSVGSVVPVKELLMDAVNKKYVGKGDKIISVGGESLGTWLKGFFFIFDVDKVFFNISTHHLTEKVNAEVIEAIIDIAQEIGTEGREGRSIGTAFIVGRKDDIMLYSKPLLRMNPFGSLPEESRKITDPEMRETIKNLAQLDGVFMIDEIGTILTAGAYINIDQNNIDLPGLQGFGTRHRCAAALTKIVDAIGVVVSASGGTVRIFKEGKVIMKLP